MFWPRHDPATANKARQQRRESVSFAAGRQRPDVAALIVSPWTAMSAIAVQNTSRIRIYWCAWLAVVALAFTLRYTVFFGASSDRLFGLATVYAVSTWLPVMVLNVIEGRKLSSYLREHHPDKWQWLTFVPGLGAGMHNAFRSLPWLYSADDLGDPVVAALKTDQKRFIKWTLTVFFSYIVVMPVLLGL